MTSQIERTKAIEYWTVAVAVIAAIASIVSAGIGGCISYRQTGIAQSQLELERPLKELEQVLKEEEIRRNEVARVDVTAEVGEGSVGINDGTTFRYVMPIRVRVSNLGRAPVAVGEIKMQLLAAKIDDILRFDKSVTSVGTLSNVAGDWHLLEEIEQIAGGTRTLLEGETLEERFHVTVACDPHTLVKARAIVSPTGRDQKWSARSTEVFVDSALCFPQEPAYPNAENAADSQ